MIGVGPGEHHNAPPSGLLGHGPLRLAGRGTSPMSSHHPAHITMRCEEGGWWLKSRMDRGPLLSSSYYWSGSPPQE